RGRGGARSGLRRRRVLLLAFLAVSLLAFLAVTAGRRLLRLCCLLPGSGRIVGDVPAFPLEDECRGRDEPTHRATAGLAGLERWRGDPLPDLEGPAALVALVFVGRHGCPGYSGGLNVSRRRGLSFVLVAVLLAGCAASKAGEVERLRARAAHERGLTALADRQRGEALVALQEAVALDPGDARYSDSLGLLLLDLGQVDQAMEQFKKALDVDPQLADSHFHLGTALAEANR